MRRDWQLRSRSAILAAALLCCAPVSAAAEEILIIITGGSFSFNANTGSGGPLPLQLVGTEGFSVTAFPQVGLTGPDCCPAPGTSTRFFGSWSGNSLPGTATLNGETFTNLGGLNSVNNLRVAFESSVFTLPTEGQSAITVTAPFTLTGTFRGAPGTGNFAMPTVEATLIGSGIGTLPFTFLSGPGGQFWDPGIVTLQLSTPLEAIPEPGSLLLIGLGLAGAYTARRQRRTATELPRSGTS